MKIKGDRSYLWFFIVLAYKIVTLSMKLFFKDYYEQ